MWLHFPEYLSSALGVLVGMCLDAHMCVCISMHMGMHVLMCVFEHVSGV